MPLVVLGLGSNISPKEKFLKEAINKLHCLYPDSFKQSPYFYSKPHANLNQDDYINCCVSFRTNDPALRILKNCQEIERLFGNPKKLFKWDSRKIDIDILLYGNERVNTAQLTIPHYDIRNREFFLYPLLQLGIEDEFDFNLRKWLEDIKIRSLKS